MSEKTNELYRIDDGSIHLITADSHYDAKRRFAKLAGCEAYEDFLRDNGIDDVKVDVVPANEQIRIFNEDTGEYENYSAADLSADPNFYASSEW